MVIRVEGLGKKYSLHHEQSERYTSLRDVVAHQAKAAGRLINPFTVAGQLRRGQPQAYQESFAREEEFWALKDVSFVIRQGERVGIIGSNGAGKSTLLKILSRITEPTTGRIEICGRVASLLEVGTGFHPELTGRENIYLNGAILGMTRREINAKFDEIVDFSEIERFLDTPVKRYSSGMYVRLAFAVAAHLEPEILVVDEVLAVGDASFQKKCLGKMEDVAEQQNRTILFVSHNIMALKSLCNTGILLQSGVLTGLGDIGDVIAKYEKTSNKLDEVYFQSWNNGNISQGDDQMRLLSAKIKQNSKSGPFLEEIEIELFVDVECGRRPNSKSLGIIISDSAGSIALHTESLAARGNKKIMQSGINHLKITVPPGIFKSGLYAVRIVGSEPMTCFHFDVQEALIFKVESNDRALLRYGSAAWLSTSSPTVCVVETIDHE